METIKRASLPATLLHHMQQSSGVRISASVLGCTGELILLDLRSLSNRFFMVAMCVLDASICRLAFLRTGLQSRSFRSLKCRLIYSVPLALQISSVHNFLHKTQNLTCPRLLLKSLFVFFFASRLDFTRPACRSKCFKLCPSSLCFPLFCSHTRTRCNLLHRKQ